MFALEAHDADQCPGGCGGQLTETTDPDIEWEADPPTICFKCRAIAAKQEEVTAPVDPDTGRPLMKHIRALLWGAKRK